MTTSAAVTIIQLVHKAPGAMNRREIVLHAEDSGSSPIPLAFPCLEIVLKMLVGAAILLAM